MVEALVRILSDKKSLPVLSAIGLETSYHGVFNQFRKGAQVSVAIIDEVVEIVGKDGQTGFDDVRDLMYSWE